MSREVAVTEKHKGREKVGDRKRERCEFQGFGLHISCILFFDVTSTGHNPHDSAHSKIREIFSISP